MNKMKIDIWSDIACPYCYIGKKKMDKVLSEFAHADEIELIWHSYVLEPDLPKNNSGKSYFQHLADSQSRNIDEVRNDFGNILALAKEVELNYNPDKLIVTNTIDALRLVKLASKYNLATEAEEVLFEAYFVKGENIGDQETLVRLGNKIGIPKDAIINCIEGSEYFEDVNNDTIQADNELNLEYIPYYMFNNKYVIQGSLSIEQYSQFIEQAYNDWKINGESDGSNKSSSMGGKSCSIDGTCSL